MKLVVIGVILNIRRLSDHPNCSITTQLWERPDWRVNGHFAIGLPLITRQLIVMFAGLGGG
jgi:hypothetical protein